MSAQPNEMASDAAVCQTDCQAQAPDSPDEFYHPNREFRRQRFAYYSNLSPEQMDRAILATIIRFYSHNLDKATKCPNSGKKHGYAKYETIKACLQEWERRGYPSRPDTQWAQRTVKHYERWLNGADALVDSLSGPPPAPSADIFEVMHGRKSVRYWHARPVEHHLLKQAVAAAMEAPCSCNRMAWKFFIIENDPSDVVMGHSANPSLLTKAPVRVYVAMDERLYPQIYAPAIDAGLATQNFVLALYALGLGASIVYQSEAVRQDKLRAAFQIPEHYNIYCAVLVGYPAEDPSRPARAPVEDAMEIIQAPPQVGSFLGA